MTTTTYPMTAGEQAELIDYATRFGWSIGHKHPRFADDVVSASLLGAAIAFESPDFPEDVEGRRKFVGQAAWNMIRRELTFFLKDQPIPFTDCDFFDGGNLLVDPREDYREVDWADEFETLAATFVGLTKDIFRLTYGPIKHTQLEIGSLVNRSVPAIQYHHKKIKAGARRRHERMGRIG